MKTASDIIRAAGLRPFQSTYRGNKNDEAGEMMGSRSYFYSRDTLAYFDCRVSWCDARMDGAVMVAVMSQKAGPNGGRVWRYAIHDFTGTHLGGDSDYTTSKAAEKALGEALAAIKPMGVVRNALMGKRDSLDYERARLAQGIKMLPRVRKPRTIA